MSTKKILHIGFFSLLFSLSAASGQSIFEDVEKLLSAIDVLENSDTETGDSSAIQASAELLAILQNYDQPLLGDSAVVGTWDDLQNRYSGNALIKGLMDNKLPAMPDSIATAATEMARALLQETAIGPRQKIMKKLHAGQAISPADYLSVSSTLERYSAPVFPPMQALALSADNSNKNVQNGGLLSQAAIIEGLFLFVLDRAKDEVVINYLDRLINDETPDFQLLFPTVVAEFGHTDFTYSNSFVARLRQAFYEDVQKLSVRLPLLLLEDDYFKPLQSDPVAYNLLALYSMISLSQFGMPVDEVVPVTHRYLYQSFEESTKEVNLILADKAYSSPEYAALISLSSSVYNQMKSIFLVLNKAEADIGNSILDFQQNFPDAPPPPFGNDYLDRPAYRLDALLGEGNAFGLNLLPQLLAGQLDSAYMLHYNTLESYDKFFGTERSPKQWRAAGIELSQKLNGTWYNEQSMAQIFYNWQKDLSQYRLATNKWMEEADPEGTLRRAVLKVERDRKKLKKTIEDSKAFWLPNLDHDQRLAFNALANLLTERVFQSIDENVELDVLLDDNLTGKEEVLKLEKKKKQLVAVEERLIKLDTTLYARNPKNFRASPLRKYLLDKKTAAPYSYLLAQIGDLEKELANLQNQIDLLESLFAKIPSRARDNAAPVLQTTELVTNLMYGLRTNGLSQKWLSRPQLDTLLDGGRKEAAFLGLLQQRLGSVKGIGPLSANGLSELVKLTIKDIQLLPNPSLPDSLRAMDTLAFYRKASFAVNTLNRILELPLVENFNRPGYYTPLKDRSKKLENIPQISGQALDFIYFINIKDHSQAISSLIQLFTNLDLSTSGKKEGKRKSAIHYLQKYGDFIAGLIDAQDQNQVKELLEHIADPPGSSRIKRKSPLTVGVNAFLGGTFGHETWQGDALEKDEDFFSPAPTMPIGIALSGLFGKKQTSFSAFISFLDLGALLSYHPDSANAGETDFTFKNVFKPGLQLQWNIKKSPFYLGLGGQYGPQYQNLDGEQISVGAARYFIGFGVDVPIKTLYQK
ncbi:MAG TPA: hypothetical protein ENJ95_19190 [Bacteroidetes bacterium]|nr:hypothetical protein [Bacteroidota bacterium]